MWLLLLLFIIGASSHTFDTYFANIAVELSAQAYCSIENYKLMPMPTNIIVTDTLYDKVSDIQGYVAVDNTNEIIYVVFRGSSSILNWLDDFEIQKVPYISYPECNCTVHKGFYYATQHLKNATQDAVFRLINTYNYNTVIVTGHSLGAAISQLIGMELARYIRSPIIYNFGQPRIGDKIYAGFVNTQIIEMYRFTHNHDIVPRVPPRVLGYLHSCREIFEEENGELRECSEVNCEDGTCSDQYTAKDLGIIDHSIYLGKVMTCTTGVEPP